MASAAGVLLGMALAAGLLGGPAAPSGGVAGIVGTPGRSGPSVIGSPVAVFGSSAAGSATPTTPSGPGAATRTPDLAGEPGTPAPAPQATPTPGPTRQPGGSLPPPTIEPSSTPTATPTPVPTPTPTPAPTPTPTAVPTPTPVPTPCRLTAPQLLGKHRNDAAHLWAAAGFTGAVTALDGRGNYVIGSQTPAAGSDQPCDAGVTIGPVTAG